MDSASINNVPLSLDAIEPPPRAARFPSFVGLARDLHDILDRLDLWVIGAGGIGLPICSHVAQLQPRALTIVDPDYFQAENLLSQRIAPDALGSNKAEYAGRLCRQLSPRTRVRTVVGRAENLPLGALCHADLVFLATDNLTVEVGVAQCCLHAGVPLVQAAVDGNMLVAQIRFCGHADGGGPCLVCAFGPAEWAHVNRETVFSCHGGNHDDAQPQPASRAATRSVWRSCVRSR